MEELLMNNIFFVYLLGILVIINYEVLEKKQKIAVIYVCSFGMTFNSNLRIITVLALLLFTLFIYEEYLGIDLVKIRYVTKIKYKCMDFIYMYVIHYKLLYVISAVILQSNTCLIFFEGFLVENPIAYIQLENVLSVISILLLMIGVHKMFNNSIELKSFKQINQKFSEYPYYQLPLRDERKKEILFEKLELVADIEDYTFFVRKNSYCSFSIEFIKAVIDKKKSQSDSTKINEVFWIHKIWQRVKLIFRLDKFILLVRKKHKMKVFRKYTKWLYKWFYFNLVQGFEHAKRNIKRYIRGYSTIEMQLIRILAYKKGLKMGKPKNLEDIYLIFTRKIYEIIYAPMFFSGLKKYLMISNVNDYYRYYLVYIYLHTVQTSLNGRVFAPLDKVFCDVDVIDWSKEALFIIALGLNNSKITKKRINVYMNIIVKYHLDLKLIYQLIECI